VANTVTVKVDADTAKAEKSVKGMGDKFRTAMSGVAKAAGAITLAAGAAAKLGEEYQDATNAIRSGTGASGKQLKGLTKSFENIAKEVPQDLGQVAKALADVNTEMGLEGKALEETTKSFLNLSRAMGEDVGPVITNVADAMAIFNVPVADTEKMLDKLTVASQASGVSVTAMAANIETFGPILKNAGFSIDETTALFAGLESEGISVSRVMPALNAAVRNLAAEGVTDLKGSLMGSIEQIKNATTDTEALNIATGVFGSDGAQRFTVGIRNGALELDGLKTAMENSDGTLEDLSANTLTMSERMDTMKNKVKLALSPIGNMATSLGPMVIMMPALATGISAVAASTKIATAATWLKAAAMAALNVAMGPVGLIILGIVAAVVIAIAIFKNWETIMNVLKETWEKVSGFIESIFRSKFAWLLPGGVFIKALLFIMDHWEEIWAAIKILAIVAWEKISELFVDNFGWALPGGALNNALDKIMDLWGEVWGSVKLKFDEIAGFIAQIWEDNFGWLRPGGAIHKALDSFRDKWSSVWTAIKGFVKGPVNFIIDGVNKLLDAMNALKIGWEAKKVRGITVVPGWEFSPFNIPHIPKMAKGGVVTSPTLAMIGESGPEAVVPLGRGGMGGGITINILGPTYGFDDFEDRVSEAVSDGVRRGGYAGVLAPA
jgi:TP901 family phage tail tape measure protein